MSVQQTQICVHRYVETLQDPIPVAVIRGYNLNRDNRTCTGKLAM